MRELRNDPAADEDLRRKIDLILRHYPSDWELQLRARLEAHSDDPYLLPEPAGSPSGPEDMRDRQGMATWDGGVLRVECPGGLRVTAQALPEEDDASIALQEWHDKLITATDLEQLEPWLRRLEWSKRPGALPELALWRAHGRRFSFVMHGVPQGDHGRYAHLALWDDFLDGP